MLNPRAPAIADRLYVALGMDGRYAEAVTAADQLAVLDARSPNALNAPVCARLVAGDRRVQPDWRGPVADLRTGRAFSAC